LSAQTKFILCGLAKNFQNRIGRNKLRFIRFKIDIVRHNRIGPCSSENFGKIEARKDKRRFYFVSRLQDAIRFTSFSALLGEKIKTAVSFRPLKKKQLRLILRDASLPVSSFARMQRLQKGTAVSPLRFNMFCSTPPADTENFYFLPRSEQKQAKNWSR
jgi:hypothetical protein